MPLRSPRTSNETTPDERLITQIERFSTIADGANGGAPSLSGPCLNWAGTETCPTKHLKRSRCGGAVSRPCHRRGPKVSTSRVGRNTGSDPVSSPRFCWIEMYRDRFLIPLATSPPALPSRGNAGRCRRAALRPDPGWSGGDHAVVDRQRLYQHLVAQGKAPGHPQRCQILQNKSPLDERILQ